jgi:hypothetical protein
MWTAKNRGRYDRSKLRYPSDLTDDEWAHVEPLIPPGVGPRCCNGVIVGAGCGFTKGARRGYLFLSRPIQLPGPIPTGAACRSLA